MGLLLCYIVSMLLLTKRSLIPFAVDDFTSVGIKVLSVNVEESIVKLVSRMADISNSEVVRKIKANALWVGNEKVTDTSETIGRGNVATTIFIGKELIGVVY